MYIIAMDTETSGAVFGNMQETVKQYQLLSVGLLLIDDSFNVHDELYVEFKVDDTKRWSNEAQDVHGLTKEYLNQYGMNEEDALVKIGSFMAKYFDLSQQILVAGHRVDFDVHFIRGLFRKYEMDIFFDDRKIDLLPAAYITTGLIKSDDIFSVLLGNKRGSHNALEDIRLTVQAMKSIREIFMLGLTN